MNVIRKLAPLSASAILGVLAACDQSEPTSLHPTSAASLLAADRGEVIVTGGGRYTGEFGAAKLTVHAIRHADGTVTGQFQQSESDPEMMAHGSVDCASRIDNRVFLSGVVTNVQHQGTTGVTEGGGFVFVIEDNGEGRSASPDRASTMLFITTPSVESCTNVRLQNILAGYTYDLESGNFQVI